jgi:hypothetical protein
MAPCARTMTGALRLCPGSHSTVGSGMTKMRRGSSGPNSLTKELTRALPETGGNIARMMLLLCTCRHAPSSSDAISDDPLQYWPHCRWRSGSTGWAGMLSTHECWCYGILTQMAVNSHSFSTLFISLAAPKKLDSFPPPS